jgi:restriction system protein
MPRKSSVWAQLQRERDQRAKAAAARERSNQQAINRILRDRDQAQRRADRAEAADRKRQQQEAHEAGAAAAAAMKADVEARVTELQALLISGLASPPQLAFSMLKRSAIVPAFDPGELRDPLPAPQWGDFAPRPPGGLSGLLGGKARHAQAEQAARIAFENALGERDRAEADRTARLHRERQDYDLMVAGVEAEVREHNAEVEEFQRSFNSAMPDAVEQFYGEVLGLSEYPDGFPRDYQVAYRPEPRELVIEYRLPGREVVPGLRDFRYVKARGEITETARPARDVKELYATVVHQLALRSMWECFSVPAGRDVVDTVVFNGIVQGTNRATGHPEELHLVSASASREEFGKLILDQLDPAECLRHLKAIVSPHPYDLVAVEPVIEFEKAKYRFAEPVDALAGIDSRPDLLKMDWYRFENLIRQLFEAMGMEVRVTQSSRDEGIDAVAYNKTDIVHRAEILIQAKRYSKCVPANDVRALAGSVEEKRATAGILVTTAWVGPESKAFAARNNRLRVIEGGELKHLLAEHLSLDVRIDLARRPRRAT